MSQTLNAAIAVVGIDIGKNSFHIVGHDERGAIVLRQKWSRGQVEARLANMPPCLIGMEACVGAHHLSRYVGRRRGRPSQVVDDFRSLSNVSELAEGSGQPKVGFPGVRYLRKETNAGLSYRKCTTERDGKTAGHSRSRCSAWGAQHYPDRVEEPKSSGDRKSQGSIRVTDLNYGAVDGLVTAHRANRL